MRDLTLFLLLQKNFNPYIFEESSMKNFNLYNFYLHSYFLSLHPYKSCIPYTFRNHLYEHFIYIHIHILFYFPFARIWKISFRIFLAIIFEETQFNIFIHNFIFTLHLYKIFSDIFYLWRSLIYKFILYLFFTWK